MGNHNIKDDKCILGYKNMVYYMDKNSIKEYECHICHMSVNEISGRNFVCQNMHAWHFIKNQRISGYHYGSFNK